MPSGSGMWTYPPIISGSAWNALLADGIINIGKSFPTSVIEGKMYYRTDLEQLYVRSGSAWNIVPDWDKVPTATFTGSINTKKHIFIYTTGSDIDVNDLTNCLWHFDGSGSGATWDATSYLVPTGSHGVLRWVDDTGYGTGDYMDLIFIRASMEPANPILYLSQHLIAKKDLAAGGFLSSNQGALFLGSGLVGIEDQPKIVLMHYGTGSDITKYGPTNKNNLQIEDVDGNLANLTAGTISGSSYQGIPTSYIQAGQGNMVGGTGSTNIVFDQEFSSTPFITATVQDAFGTLNRSINIISKSSTGFRITINIGQHLHTGSGNTGAESAHTHTFADDFDVVNAGAGTPSGTIGNESTHTHDLMLDTVKWTTDANTPPPDAHTHTYDEGINTQSDSGPCTAHNHSFTGNALGVHGHGGSVSGTTSTGVSHVHTSGDVALSGSMGVGYDTTFDWIAVGTGFA